MSVKQFIGQSSNFFKNIENITKSLFDINQVLCFLEINNKKGIEEYKKYLKYLELISEIEQKLYSDLTQSDILKFMQYIKSAYYPNGIDSDIVCFLNNEDLIIRRIFNRLILEDLNNNQVNSISKFYYSSLLEGIEYDNYQLINFIKNDYIKIFLLLLFSSNDSRLKSDELIKVKYFLSFINYDIEKILMSKNYDIHALDFLSAKFNAQIYDISEDVFKYLSSKINIDRATIELDSIIENKDSDFNDDRAIFFKEIMIRSSLRFLDKRDMQSINEFILKRMNSKDFLANHEYDKIGKIIIDTIFKEVRFDKEVGKELSFKR